MLKVSRIWKQELSILWFLTTHNLKIIGGALPLVLLGISLLQFAIFNLVQDDLRKNFDLLRLFLNNDYLYNYYLSAAYNIENVSRIFAYHLSFSVKFLISSCSAIIAFLALFYSHRSLITNYVPKAFKLKTGGNIWQDLKFFSCWIGINVIFNIIMMYFSFPSFLFKMISTYLVQNIIFYVLVKKEVCGYSINSIK